MNMGRCISKHAYIFILLLLFLLVPTISHAQDNDSQPNLVFTRLTTEDGLPTVDVRDITQDSQGFMWFGTTNAGGLVRYDGHDMKVFVHDKEDDTSISNSSIWFVFIDQSDTLWAGTWEGLSRYNRETEDFTRYLHDPDDPTTLPNNRMFDMYQTADGTMWVTTAVGLSRFDPDSGTFFTYAHDPEDPNSPPASSVRSIHEDSESGLLYLGVRRGGFTVFDPNSEQFTNYLPDPEDPTSISDSTVDVIYEGKNGAIWLGTRNGLNRFDRETQTFTSYVNDPDDATTIGSNVISALHEDSNNRFWVGTAVGLDIFDPQTETFVHYTHHESDPSTLGLGDVRSLYEDRTGTIWVSTLLGGVSRLSESLSKFSVYVHDPDNPESISDGFVWDIDAAPQGGFWIVTQGGSKSILNYFDGNTFTRYAHDPEKPDSWPEFMRSVAVDKQGNLWIGTAVGGLSYYDIESEAITHFTIPTPSGTGAVIVKEVANDGTLWFANDGGLTRFDGETFTSFTPDAENPDSSMPSLYIHGTSPDQQDDSTFWVATAALVKINSDSETVTTYRYDDETSEQERNTILHIEQTQDGILWLTSPNGLHRFDPTTERFTDLFTAADGFPNDRVLGIVEDNDGMLWIGDDKEGLMRFDPVSKEIRRYRTMLGGLQTNEIWQLYRGVDGRIVGSGASGGLVAFYPDQVIENSAIPPVVLTELELFNVPAVVGAEDGILPQTITSIDELVLNYDQTFISFAFSALNYESPDQNQFAYFLEGFDDEWRVATVERRFAPYTNIPPGRYTFRVKASNNSGVWNESGIALPITVTPPWWQTNLAYALYAIGLVGAIAGVIRWRTSSVEKRNQALQRKLEERERTQAEKEVLLDAVQEQVTRVESIMSTVPTGILLLSPDHRVVSANPVAEADLAVVAGIGVGEIVTHFGDRPIEALLKPPAEGLWHEVVVEDTIPSRYFAVTARSFDDGHVLNNWVVILQDVTIERSLQAKAIAQQRMASIGVFTAGIAHDFNNMLSVILLNAELTQKQFPNLDPNFASRLDRISQQVQNGALLIQQILDYSRQTVMERRAIDLQLIVQNYRSLLSQWLSSNFELLLSIDEPDEYSIYGDATQIQQILMNLVANARDAMPDGGEIEISLSSIETTDNDKPFDLLPPRRWITLTVRDEGTGIPKEVLPRIFEPFVTTKPIGKGTGLGLAQIFGIVKQHDGYIDVKTEIGQGTSFIIYLPKYEGIVHQLPTNLDSRDIPQGNGETILIMDDNLSIIEVLAESLEDINYRVLVASNGEEGLAVWRENEELIDVVVTDVVMPKMSGVGFVGALHAAGATQPIIFMTGHLLEQEAELQFETLRQQGLVDWLRKPIDFKELVRTVAKVLRSKRGDEEITGQ